MLRIAISLLPVVAAVVSVPGGDEHIRIPAGAHQVNLHEVEGDDIQMPAGDEREKEVLVEGSHFRKAEESQRALMPLMNKNKKWFGSFGKAISNTFHKVVKTVTHVVKKVVDTGVGALLKGTQFECIVTDPVKGIIAKTFEGGAFKEDVIFKDGALTADGTTLVNCVFKMVPQMKTIVDEATGKLTDAVNDVWDADKDEFKQDNEVGKLLHMFANCEAQIPKFEHYLIAKVTAGNEGAAKLVQTALNIIGANKLVEDACKISGDFVCGALADTDAVVKKLPSGEARNESMAAMCELCENEWGADSGAYKELECGS